MRDSNSDIALMSEKIAAQQGAIASLASSVATGRLVVPLADIVAYRAQDVVLKDGDRLLVPKISQEVTILGEVRRPTSYLFDPDFSQSDYIEQSGGFKDRADKNDIYHREGGRGGHHAQERLSLSSDLQRTLLVLVTPLLCLLIQMTPELEGYLCLLKCPRSFISCHLVLQRLNHSATTRSCKKQKTLIVEGIGSWKIILKLVISTMMK